MSRLVWPLHGLDPLLPGNELGSFGRETGGTMRTRVDLYCERGQSVVSVEEGTVVAIVPFSGKHTRENPNSTDHDTFAVLVEGPAGVVVYGNVHPLVAVGKRVKADEHIASVVPRCSHFTGVPMVMLGFELHATGSRELLRWYRGDPRPDALLDPIPLLRDAADGPISMFDLDFYDEVRFRASETPWQGNGGLV